MPHHHLPRPDDEQALRDAEYPADARADLERVVDRACQQASLPFTHSSIHRLARDERARRLGPGEEDAA